MVAKIKTGRSVLGAINYNEHKVRQGKAGLILAQGYLTDPVKLTFRDKLQRLTDLTQRNERTLVNTLHVSLNFAINESLDQDTLRRIADDYMTGLGFGKQPYLVYQHYDAGHPHLHIVTTNIEPDGKRISFHLLANRTSEAARKHVELNYGLVKAEDQAMQQKAMRQPLQQVIYGKSALKRTITNVVNEVLGSYKFTSIPELNAILHLYNITADRGSRESRMYQKKGLVYWALDEKGNKRGVPIKASSIYNRPTLKALEGRFRLNELLRRPLKERLKTVIDKNMVTPISKSAFQKQLYAESVDVIFRQNKDDLLYGLTFVDHHSKVVFNGSDLGKSYSAASLSNWFKNEIPVSHQPRAEKANKRIPSSDLADSISGSIAVTDNRESLLDVLFKEDQLDMSAVSRLWQRKRRKKRKGHSL